MSAILALADIGTKSTTLAQNCCPNARQRLHPRFLAGAFRNAPSARRRSEVPRTGIGDLGGINFPRNKSQPFTGIYARRCSRRWPRFLEPGQQLGIVDDHCNLAPGDMIAAVDRTLYHPTVDSRRDVHARRIDLLLEQQRLRLDEVPKRQGDDRGDRQRDDDSSRAWRTRWRPKNVAPFRFALPQRRKRRAQRR